MTCSGSVGSQDRTPGSNGSTDVLRKGRRCAFSYSTERADLVATQLERFTTAFDHIVVGHHANLEFWVTEVAQAVAALDTYSTRFERHGTAQGDWVEQHHVRVGTGDFCNTCGGRCEFEAELTKPARPRRVPSHDRDGARRRVRDAAYNFIVRAYRVGVMDRAALNRACSQLAGR